MGGLVWRLNRLHDVLDGFRALDFLAPLAIRLYLAPVFLVFGWKKVENFDAIVSWFGEGLGLPLPWLMAFLATGAELVGGALLLVGLATRYVAVPLLVTMVVAIGAVHWENGWYAIAPTAPGEHVARPLAAIGVDAAQEAVAGTGEAALRLERARSLLREHGNYRWLTERGSLAILNNGIEFAATYLVMLLVLFFGGAGRWFSLDHWIRRRFRDVQED